MQWAILRCSSFYPIKIQFLNFIACCLLHLIRTETHVDPFVHEVHDLDIDEVNQEAGFLRTIE